MVSEPSVPAEGMLRDRIVLVTGASRGLGRAVAAAAARHGAQVIATARTRADLEELDDEVRSAGTALTLLPLDLLKVEDVDRLGPSIFERFGRLDAFCHCAAELGVLTRVTDIAPKTLERIFALNVLATQRLLRTLDPLFRASSAPTVVAVTDGVASRGSAYWGHYSATKLAYEALIRAYRAETAFRGLKVNLIDPGPMATRLRAQAYPGEAQDRQPSPEAVAPRLLPYLATDCRQFDGIVALH